MVAVAGVTKGRGRGRVSISPSGLGWELRKVFGAGLSGTILWREVENVIKVDRPLQWGFSVQYSPDGIARLHLAFEAKNRAEADQAFAAIRTFATPDEQSEGLGDEGTR